MCDGDMRQYERSGITVDQCTDCRGIFLDRGELEKLLEAEANWNRRNAPTGAAPQAHQGPPPAGGYAPQPPQPAYGGYPPQPALRRWSLRLPRPLPAQAPQELPERVVRLITSLDRLSGAVAP
jgi:hypothetical protein